MSGDAPPRSLAVDLDAQHRHPVNTAAAVLVATALTLLVLVAVLPNLWYRLHDISDIFVYADYAAKMASGLRPFRDFAIEYPPLAVPLFRLPGHTAEVDAYVHWFTLQMGLVTVLTAAVTAVVACRLWPTGGRAYVAAALFAVGVALTGAIIVNRYDAAVALLIAVFLLCLCERWWIAAAFVLGLGFALKITPAALLPLVLLLMGDPRRWGWPLAAFGAAAVAPFLPYLFSSADGLWYVFDYHLSRPLQIESVLGTPMLIGELLGVSSATWGHSFGSHSLAAPGVGLAADLSGGLTVLALAAVYALIWRRRTRLRAVRPDVALAALALILALMTFGKVLSPQYFIWTLPVVALVAARDRLLGALAFATLLLTQVEFPALYWRFLDMEPPSLSVVIARNLLLLVLFGAALWRLWSLPEEAGPEARAQAAAPSASRAAA
jgi:hypothetical protein